MIYTTLFFLAQTSAAPSATGQSPNGLSMLVPFACIGVIFYFLIIRPQSKKQKDHDVLVKSVETGDKVVTTGGIHGMVSNLKETTVIVKIAENVKIELDKSCISSVVKAASGKA